MKYIIAGKSDSFLAYRDKHKDETTQLCNARTKKIFNDITAEDTIVLLHGWWAKSWAIDALKEVSKVFPTIVFEFLDGPFGESERNKLKSENISNRFDILDL